MLKTMHKAINKLSLYIHPKVLFVSFFGFINGFLLLVSGNTLNFWLASEKINLASIGLITLVALPYTLKFTLAPFIERVNLPFLHNIYSRKKSWLILCFFCLTFFIFLLSKLNPHTELSKLCVYSVFIAFFSCGIDIILNSYRIDLIEEKMNSIASTAYIVGYKVGGIVSGAFAIYLSSYLSWNQIYTIITFITLIWFLFFLINNEIIEEVTKKQNRIESDQNWLYRIFIMPFSHLGNFSRLIIIILFISFYRLSDNMILVMINPFLTEYGYSSNDIATAGKLCGLLLSILGSLFGGLTILYFGVRKNLFFSGLIHTLTHFSYFLIIVFGYNLTSLYFITIIEAFTGGITMSAYIAYITSLCKGQYTGTQYAVFFSVVGASRVILPSLSGYIVEYSNWSFFFLVSILLTIPGLYLVKYIPILKKSSNTNSNF